MELNGCIALVLFPTLVLVLALRYLPTLAINFLFKSMIDNRYGGGWADLAVAAVAAQGGHLQVEDLARYVATSPTTRNTTIVSGLNPSQKYIAHAPGYPSYGGVGAIESHNLIELAIIGRFFDPSIPYKDSPEAVFWM